jgi:FkbM family methyltransferase
LKQLAKQIVRNAFRRHGFDLIKTPHLHTYLASREVDLVVDVGANNGGYGTYLRRWGYRGRILSFEPTMQAFRDLLRTGSGYRGWDALNLALGREPGELVINVSKDSRFSSFYALSADGVSYDPRAAVQSQERVKVSTLDEIMRTDKAQRPFLKIDTQGAERDVLDGAGEFLSRCVGVQLELPIQQLYEGVWSFREALAYMEERGFMLAQAVPTNPRHDDFASVCEFDCVFRPIAEVKAQSRPRLVA